MKILIVSRISDDPDNFYESALATVDDKIADTLLISHVTHNHRGILCL